VAAARIVNEAHDLMRAGLPHGVGDNSGMAAGAPNDELMSLRRHKENSAKPRVK
jgi:hypothetical protein